MSIDASHLEQPSINFYQPNIFEIDRPTKYSEHFESHGDLNPTKLHYN